MATEIIGMVIDIILILTKTMIWQRANTYWMISIDPNTRMALISTACIFGAQTHKTAAGLTAVTMSALGGSMSALRSQLSYYSHFVAASGAA